MHVRGRDTKHIGTKVTFVCPKGHKSTHDYSKGPVSGRIGADGLRFLFKYWKDGIYYECDKCSREEES